MFPDISNYLSNTLGYLTNTSLCVWNLYKETIMAVQHTITEIIAAVKSTTSSFVQTVRELPSAMFTCNRKKVWQYYFKCWY